MGGWKMWFVLLLPLTLCIDREATLVKTGKQFVTPVCVNGTDRKDIITLIVCKIHTERNRGELCRLVYQFGKDFEHGCGSRFRLMTENQTVFLHLSSLTAEDNGNYTCECSHVDGTDTLRLNVSVEEDEDTSSSLENPVSNHIIYSVSCVTIFIIITGVILLCSHKKLCHRRRPENLDHHSNMEPQDAEPYDTFIQRENEIYSAAEMTQI